jgi:hypothetical protein
MVSLHVKIHPMKKCIFIIASIVVFSSCLKKYKDITNRFENTRWQLTEIDGISISSLQPIIDSLGGDIPTIHFLDELNAKGTTFCSGSGWDVEVFGFSFHKKYDRYFLVKSTITGKSICDSRALSDLTANYYLLLNQSYTFELTENLLKLYSFNDNKKKILEFKKL